MKVGSLVFATDSGLGILAKSFYDHGVVTDVMVVQHGRHETHNWYPSAKQIANFNDLHTQQDVATFIDSMDVMLFFETPYKWRYISDCRNLGTKTALMVMHECLHESVWQRQNRPDLFLCPSLLDLQVIDKSHNGCMQMFLPVPVECTWRHRERARVFVHNAGHGGLKGRNGTVELLSAWKYVESPAKLIVRSQQKLDSRLEDGRDKRIEFQGTVGYDQLWTDGDVFVFPEKFNGLSLPLQEARAAGMLVMCGDRFPMNTWLPREPLIPVQGYHKDRTYPQFHEFDCAQFDPRTIAATIDAWYDKDISEYSRQGKEWAEQNSWTTLKPIYTNALEMLCS